ncbi:hypothetical protein ACFWYW_56770 [Nonomuraea sp. NPDC059023]|uniref:hypothetical protein n=1 Tax=unclassified Nonomuraea TaxID=2593643 RepID=UPI00368B6BB9
MTSARKPKTLRESALSLLVLGSALLVLTALGIAVVALAELLPAWLRWTALGGTLALVFFWGARARYQSMHSAYLQTVKALAAVHESPALRLNVLNSKIQASMQLTSSLMADLDRELRAQRAASEALAARTSEQRRYFEINEEQAKKVKAILSQQSEQAQADIRAHQLRQQWLFFGLGAAISIPIGIAVNLLFP